MSDFAWTFPCYVLVAVSESGRIGFAAPGGRLGLFTDIDLVERYREEFHPAFTPLPIFDALTTRRFLESLSDDFPGVDVDADGQKARRFGFPQLIRSLPV
ncbi:MAG: hypothetical protein RIC55_21475 [Pirellulaceae bacterium]